MFGRYRLIICLILYGAGLFARPLCTVREAQQTLRMADSVWAVGQMYNDSVGLAQAYNTLHAWRVLYPDNYAHACYHYGRLLRQKNDPVSAMQTFISATHSRSRDYHILGRVYNNMGDMCHIAGNYPLSYDMFKLSAEMYLRNGDSLLYYYGLNDMAFEIAEQGKTEETFIILTFIDEHCSDRYVMVKALETKAEAYLHSHQYDSALYYSSKLLAMGYYDPCGVLIHAQAFSMLGMKDSAVYYADILLSISQDLYNQCNALYILTNDDESKNITSIREIAAYRADTQKLIEIQKSKLSQAVQLLEQDLHKKPNLAWLYAIIATGILSGGLFYWRYRIRQKQLQTHVAHIIERQADTITQSIKKHIDTNDLNHTLHWKEYAAMKADADLYMGGIVTKLEEKKLNETEIRFCVLTLLDFSQSQIAQTIHYGYPSGIKTLKKRLSDKLETTPQNLKNFLLQLATNG